MRVLLVCLLAAISYAQTGTELEDDQSKAVAEAKFKEFSDPQNIVGVAKKPFNPRDLDLEMPLSMPIFREDPVGNWFTQKFSKWKDSAAAKTTKKAIEFITGEINTLVAWIQEKEKNSDLITPLIQTAKDIKDIFLDMKNAAVNWRETLQNFKKSIVEKGSKTDIEKAADNLVGDYVTHFVDKANKLRIILGFMGTEGILASIGVQYGIEGSAILGAGDSVTAFFGLEKPDRLPVANEKLAFSVCATAGFKVGLALEASATFSIVVSHNTAPGGEAGFGLSVDLKAAYAAGLKFSLNWAFRNKKMEFTGITIGISAGAGAGVQVTGSYTGTIFKYNTPRKGALKNIFKDAKAKAVKVKDTFKQHMKYTYDIDIFGPPKAKRAETQVNEGAQTPEETVKFAEAEVQESLSAKDKIKRVLALVNPTTVECFAGFSLMLTFVLFFARNAERKNEYLLIGDDYDEI